MPEKRPHVKFFFKKLGAAICIAQVFGCIAARVDLHADGAALKGGIDGDVDLVLLEGAFSLYLPVLKLLEPHLRDGAFVIGDNALEQSGYLDYVRNPQNGYLSLPLPFSAGRGNELTVVTR